MAGLLGVGDPISILALGRTDWLIAMAITQAAVDIETTRQENQAKRIGAEMVKILNAVMR